MTKKILLTGGRLPLALDIARKLHAAGHTVFVAETSQFHVCNASNAVKKSFVVPSPRFHFKEFASSLRDIVIANEIDLVVPVFEEIIYVSKTLSIFPEKTKVLTVPFELLNQLHNKWLFTELQKKLEIEPPLAHLITSREDLQLLSKEKTYALKAVYNRAARNIYQVNPTTDLDQLPIDFHIENPWIAQEWLNGTQYCSYSIVQRGQIVANSIYPVRFTCEGHSCISYLSIHHAQILGWITYFVKAIEFTGQIAFDFIEVPGKGIFAIECNPRATSGVYLFENSDHIDQAFTAEVLNPPILAKTGVHRHLLTGHLLFGWRNVNRKSHLPSFFEQLFTVADVVFDIHDLKPFFFQSLLLPKYLYDKYKLGLPLTLAQNYDIEWNGETIPDL